MTPEDEAPRARRRRAAPLLPDVDDAWSLSGRELRHSLLLWMRNFAVLGTILVGAELVIMVRTVMVAIFPAVLDILFGAILAVVVGPVVDALEWRTRLSRTFASILVLLAAVGLIAVMLLVAAGPVVDETRTLAHSLPQLLSRAQNTSDAFRRSLAHSGIVVAKFSVPTAGITTALEGVLLKGITSTLTVIADVVVTFVLAFWFLRDGEKLRQGSVSLLPAQLRSDVNFALDASSVVVGGFIRAQVLMGILIGGMAGLGCWALGVHYPLVVALAAGIFELIPLAGPFLGGAVGVALALTVSPILAIKVVILFLGIHFVDGYLVSPRLQGKFVRIHPVVALMAIVVGTSADGFVGALFAVPVASLAAVFIRVIVGDWKEHNPAAFEAEPHDRGFEGRRRNLLREFRFFNKTREK